MILLTAEYTYESLSKCTLYISYTNYTQVIAGIVTQNFHLQQRHWAEIRP